MNGRLEQNPAYGIISPGKRRKNGKGYDESDFYQCHTSFVFMGNRRNLLGAEKGFDK